MNFKCRFDFQAGAGCSNRSSGGEAGSLRVVGSTSLSSAMDHSDLVLVSGLAAASLVPNAARQITHPAADPSSADPAPTIPAGTRSTCPKTSLAALPGSPANRRGFSYTETTLMTRFFDPALDLSKNRWFPPDHDTP